MKKLLQITFVLLLLNSMTVLAQASSDSVKVRISKKWKLEKYKDTDGKMYPPLLVMKNDYTKYNLDGTLESYEQGTLIKGNWVFDEKTMELTTTQTQVKEYPAKIVAKVIKLNKTELVLEATDAEGKVFTLYLKPVN